LNKTLSNYNFTLPKLLFMRRRLSLRKGMSLHVGINRYDTVAYGKSGRALRSLPNCHRDAEAKMRIAKHFGYNSAILINEHATPEKVLAGITDAANYLEHGDIFFLSFSGHGTRVPDRNGDEDDGYDEAWCLYNNILMDDELFEKWKEFRPGVRILVIVDSCHSGTSIKNPETNQEYHSGRFPMEKANEVQASCLLLASCQDKQYSYSGINIHNSLYTYWMLEILKQYEYCDSYRELHNRISNHMPPASQPNLFPFGPGANQFVKMRPFKI
jgi:metacaspase-1